jgi:tripartite-type tricarboxylate transporter receptor subunit TctC
MIDPGRQSKARGRIRVNKGKTKRVMFTQIGKVLCGAILAATIGAAATRAQDYPTRPLSIVVPFPAGGVTDTVVRLLTERMRTVLGQPIVTENMGGASGTIGAAHVARASPDGYTLLLGNSEIFVLTPATMKLPYDPAKDFVPIALLPSYPFILVSTNDVPAKTLKELIAWIKANPQKLLQGTVGSGTAQQLCGVSIQQMIGTKWQLIPYRGGPPAMQDMLAGQINFMCTATGSFLPLVRAGKIRAYALTAKARSEAAPDIPTVDEAGLPGLYVSVWNALWAPAGTPPEIVAKLNVAADAAMADPVFHKRIVEMGLDMPPADQRTPEALESLRKADIAKWWPVIKAAGLKVE